MSPILRIITMTGRYASKYSNVTSKSGRQCPSGSTGFQHPDIRMFYEIKLTSHGILMSFEKHFFFGPDHCAKISCDIVRFQTHCATPRWVPKPCGARPRPTAHVHGIRGNGGALTQLELLMPNTSQTTNLNLNSCGE